MKETVDGRKKERLLGWANTRDNISPLIVHSVEKLAANGDKTGTQLSGEFSVLKILSKKGDSVRICETVSFFPLRD